MISNLEARISFVSGCLLAQVSKILKNNLGVPDVQTAPLGKRLHRDGVTNDSSVRRKYLGFDSNDARHLKAVFVLRPD
jgi:hypothetical protein